MYVDSAHFKVSVEVISHLLVRGLPSGINSTMADCFFLGLSHARACARTLSRETWQTGELQEKKNSQKVCHNNFQRGRKRGCVS